MRLAQGRSGDVLTTRGTAVVGAVLLLLTLVLLKLGWCSCTLFAVNSWALVGSAVLLLGNRSFGVLAEEKEKKTLDCLRLTQLSPSALFFYKLAPEFRSLARLLLWMSPAVLLSAVVSPSGLGSGLAVLLIAFLSGLMSISASLMVSSLAGSTSRAVVQGWSLKACWLLLTPLFDLVVAAVTVTTQRFPVFDAINPFAAMWPLVVPEAELGLRQQLPAVFVVLSALASAVMWKIAAVRYESGLAAAASLTDRQVHRLYNRQPSWLPNWLGLKENPVFLRELAAQLRSGAGQWPGYAVFVTLFLAPYLYSQSWNVRRTSEFELTRRPEHLTVAPAPQQQPGMTAAVTGPTSSFVRLSSWDGTELRLKGHNHQACLRTKLYQLGQVPLPASALVKVAYQEPLMEAETGQIPSRPGPTEAKLTTEEAWSYGLASPSQQAPNSQLSPNTLESIRLHSLSQGLVGCLVLLTLYLGVRCSGFLANAVTSECDRRSWNDLALTGIGPQQVLLGKLAGALVMPLFQLLLASPSLLLFTWAGAFSLGSVIALVSYSCLLAITAGLIGFWASSTSQTSHAAQGRALASILVWLLLVPAVVLSGGSGLGLLMVAGFLLSSHPRGKVGWALVGLAALISPLGLSPWTCLLQGLVVPHASPLIYLSGILTLVGLSLAAFYSTLANLGEPGQADTLRAERIA